MTGGGCLGQDSARGLESHLGWTGEALQPTCRRPQCYEMSLFGQQGGGLPVSQASQYLLLHPGRAHAVISP